MRQTDVMQKLIDMNARRKNSKQRREAMNKALLKKKYDRLFRRDPAAANLFLLLAELADEKGQVVTDEKELSVLMAARFEDPRRYSL
jgi:hypothetical protein